MTTPELSKNHQTTKNTGSINQEEISSYLKDIRKLKVMTPDRERQLSDLILDINCTERQKQQIHKELLEGNLRFVITVAKQYQNQGLDLSDLIAEGNLGLIKAIQNFDWTKKLRFISYAVWWVKQSILQSLNENAKGISELDSRLATLPTTINLQQTINEDGDTLLDMIINQNASMPDEGLNTEEMLKEKLLSILSILDERERIIVEDYFGLTGTPRTLEDIGNDFKLTKERVRQIKEKALRKLRNECSTLFDYL